MNRCEPAEKTEQNPNGIWHRNGTLNIEHMESKEEKKNNIKTKLESYFQLSIQPITFWF